MVNLKLAIPVVLFFLLSTFHINAQNGNVEFSDQNKLNATYDKSGLSIFTNDDFFKADIDLRLQSRFYLYHNSDPRSESSFMKKSNPAFIFRRVRIKSNGHVYSKWFKYKVEYDMGISRLYDLYFSFEKYKGFKVRFGQNKALYNRERVISSGNQTFTERSIVNRVFTIDRQLGLTVYGNVGKKSPANLSYLISVYTGSGSLALVNDDNNMMYAGRLQWNILGGGVKIGQEDSDFENSQKPRLSAAIAGVTNVSPYNRFSSSSGGGLLDLYSESERGQYKVDQYVQDFIFKYKGFSILEEYHFKSVDDRINDADQKLDGFFIQAGIFPGYLIDGFPEPLQFAVRYAFVDNDVETNLIDRNEVTIGANWYFNGFRNRLMADFSMLDLMRPDDSNLSTTRFRLQWDITI